MRRGRYGHHLAVDGRLLFNCLTTTFGLFNFFMEKEKLKRDGQSEMGVLISLCVKREIKQESSLDLQNRKMNKNFRIFLNRA